MRAYMRFSLQGVNGSITSAVLRVHTSGSNPTGYVVSKVPDTAWGEKTISYNNAPTLGPQVGSSGPFASGVWTQVDLTGQVAGTGLVSLALTTTSTTVMNLASRESGANAPQLVITTTTTPDSAPPSVPEMLAATPAGHEIRAEAEVTKVEGRRVEFTVSARDESEEIGRGTHHRMVVDIARVNERLAKKPPRA